MRGIRCTSARMCRAGGHCKNRIRFTLWETHFFPHFAHFPTRTCPRHVGSWYSLLLLSVAMGIDIRHNNYRKKGGRHAPVSENLYLRLLVKLYRFLARRTGADANKVILKRLFTSRVNRPPISLKTGAKHLGDSGKIAVIVGSVTDEVRTFDCPAMTVCALRFTNTARAKLLKAGGTCLTFDQLALKAPLGENCMLLRGCKSHRESAKHFSAKYGAPGTPHGTARPYVRAKGRKFEKARGKRASRGYRN
jgi:large subunit ribosomal protein L18e